MWSGTTWISTRLLWSSTDHPRFCYNIFRILSCFFLFSGMMVESVLLPRMHASSQETGECMWWDCCEGFWQLDPSLQNFHSLFSQKHHLKIRYFDQTKMGGGMQPFFLHFACFVCVHCVFRVLRKRASFICNFCTENPLSYWMFYTVFFSFFQVLQKVFKNTFEILLE